MKVKLSTIIFTVILSVFYLQIVSCNKVTKPETINEIDPKTGRYQKISSYKFNNSFGFIFHGLENQEIVKQIRHDKLQNDAFVRAKKLVSSQYFDIWVDTANYEKAVNLQDTAWYKLISDLQRHYIRLVNIYGARNIDMSLKNNKDKVEIIFHENYDRFKNNTSDGFFDDERNISINANMYLTNMESYRLKVTIIHELQHYINFHVRNDNAKNKYYYYNEALSESTYNVILGSNSLYRRGDFSNSRKGEYFFNHDRSNTHKVDIEILKGYYKTEASFMYWLYIHGGEKIIKDIVRNKQIDHKAIADAAIRNIPYFVGKDYNSLIFSWYKANFYNNPSGLLGYKRKDKIDVHLAIAPGEKIELKPQCAVYTMQDMYDKNKNIGDTNIWLAKLSDSKRKWLLIYNSGSYTKTVYIRNSNIPIWNNSNLPTWDKNKSWTKNNSSIPTWK